MKILGLQKLSLLDYPGKVACTVFTGGCNFRCPFCHNGDLVTGKAEPPEIPAEEVLAFLAKRRGVLEGVAVTGGEPLLCPDLPDFLREVRALGYSVKLDTNGYLPARLEAVVEEGLADAVAMDIKNAPERYAETAGIPGLDLAPVRESAEFLLSGATDAEFRTTVVREFHRPEDIRAAAEWIRGAKKYFLQAFKESDYVIRPGLSPYSEEEMRALLEIAREFVPNARIRGE